MYIDFKDINPGNRGGEHQDDFEFFAKAFLKSLGFRIEKDPARGADGKMDLIVSENIAGNKPFRWLVSCKHNAVSGKSVTDIDEPTLETRLKVHNCHGFMGFYSTIAANSLTRNLATIEHFCIYDRDSIEEALLTPEREPLVLRYFQKSHARCGKFFNNKKNKSVVVKKNSSSKESTANSDDALVMASLNGHIIFELAKIRRNFFSSDWNERKEILEQLEPLLEYSNRKTALKILTFVEDIASETRYGLPHNMLNSISLIVMSLCTTDVIESSDKIDQQLVKSAGNIAFSLIYDDFIKLNNFWIAEEGFLILKYLYSYGKANSDTRNLILKIYSKIEAQLIRPGTDLSKAKEFTKAFKDDLEEDGFDVPLTASLVYL